jgi:hypothetical protein
MKDTSIYLAAAIFSGIYVFSALIYLVAKKYLSLKEKEMELERVRLDEFRAHVDRQLAEINNKFLGDPARWREVNHMLISAQSEIDRDDPSRPHDFLIRHGVRPELLSQKSRSVFVLTPFHEDYLEEYEAISRAIASVGLLASRGDETKIHGDIFPHILGAIARARLVIANISGRNPNVFYELGIAHALDKNVILVSQHEKDLPFDLRSKQILMYRDCRELEMKLSTMIPRTLLDQGG